VALRIIAAATAGLRTCQPRRAGHPLFKDQRLGVHLKLDYLLPSGSYKDRGATVLASRLKALRVKDIMLDSSDNAGAAMSTYC
jgi:threonine synthase